jgi:hypothetical protein
MSFALNITPTVIWTIFFVVLSYFVIINYILLYHWKKYTFEKKVSSRIQKTFYYVSGILLLVMLTSAVVYTL